MIILNHISLALHNLVLCLINWILYVPQKILKVLRGTYLSDVSNFRILKKLLIYEFYAQNSIYARQYLRYIIR